jgi:hypothetical protein
MLWKVIDGNLVDPTQIVAIMPEMGMSEDGSLSFVLKVVLRNGMVMDADEIVFREGDAPDPNAEDMEDQRDAIVFGHLMSLAQYLNIAVDLEPPSEVAIMFGGTEDYNPEFD